MRFGKSLLIGLLASAAHSPLQAQDAPPPPPAQTLAAAPSADVLDEETDGEEIVVTGQRERGAVVGDIPPVVQLDRRDIRAYGAGSLSELLDALSPQTGSGQGRGGERPVVLLNGRRISGFSEIRDIPPEAIERIDIMPEEVALKYGYAADQKVVNFVLRERFRANTADAEYGVATAGGRTNYKAGLNVLKIDSAGRWSLDFDYAHESPLFESERDIIQSPPSRPYDLLGNVGPAAGTEVDPALSALAGQTVTVAGVPAGAATAAPSLRDFVAGANNANQSDLGAYRTLLPETHQYAINGTLNRTIFGSVGATLNARFEESASNSKFGLASGAIALPSTNPYSPFSSDVTLYRYFDAPGALTRDSEGRTGHLGLALNGDIDPWRWSVTANYDRANNISRSDTSADLAHVQPRISAGDPTLNPFSPFPATLVGFGPQDRSKSRSESATGEFVASGPLFTLPAGKVSATVKLGGELSSFASDTLRSGIAQSREFSRDRANAQANVDIPLASRRRDVLAALGDLSVNFNAEAERVSDFGTLTTVGYGVNWSPIVPVRLIASVSHEDGAPSVQQIGDPVTLNPNVRVFDFLRGETVDITRLEGGNPALIADNRRVLKLGLTVKPFTQQDLTLTANYTDNRIRNPIASFPTATSEIEAAFPERFLRDASGRLLSIDSRPVNFLESDRQQIRWGINFSKPIKQAVPQRGFGRRGAADSAGAAPGGAPVAGGANPAPGQTAQGGAAVSERPRGGPGGFGGPGGGGRGFGGRGFGGGGGGPQGGRLQFALYHTWHLKDSILIRDGVPELDLLNGSAVGSRGGQPTHEVEFQSGIFKNGMGARLSANWQSGTTVRGAPNVAGGTSSDLVFSDLATFNLRLFADLGAQRSLVRNHRWLRGTRVTLAVDNLLDSHLRVRDAAGLTPISYQPDYLDPLGRTIKIGVRKMF